MTLKCLIVDDEPLARKGMADYTREVNFLTLVAECNSAATAMPYLERGEIDLLLLDVQMPRMSGIELLKSLPSPPMVIITTAFSEFALEGYALDVMDYLLKPIPFDRFLKAVTKARDFHALKRSANESRVMPDFFFVKCNGKFERVYFDDILFIEAMQNYVMIHVVGSKLMVYMTLSGMEEQLPQDKFMHVHKSYVVAISKVEAIENHEIVIQQHRVPISRSLHDEVKRRILGSNLLSR